MAEKTNYIIDFDSTFTKEEALDVLGEISLAGRPEREDVLDQIKTITERGMAGQISFTDSLNLRLALLKANRNHLPLLISSVAATPSLETGRIVSIAVLLRASIAAHSSAIASRSAASGAKVGECQLAAAASEPRRRTSGTSPTSSVPRRTQSSSRVPCPKARHQASIHPGLIHGAAPTPSASSCQGSTIGPKVRATSVAIGGMVLGSSL